jgi:asparaginyl-tRNA synthetase
MTRLTCADILAGRASADSPITVSGWVRTRRDSKAGISFVHVSDGSGFHPVQVVAPGTLANYASEVQHLTAGCAVEATGKVVPSPAKGQPFEMQADSIRVIGWVEDPDTYPIQPKPHTLEFLREVAHLRPRTNVIGALTRVRHTIAKAIHGFFDQHGFCWVNTPIITASDAEARGAVPGVHARPANLPRTPEGKVDYAQDFFGREPFSPYRDSSTWGLMPRAVEGSRSGRPSVRRTRTRAGISPSSDDRAGVAFAALRHNADLAEALLKHLQDGAAERGDDMAFFEERIEGLMPSSRASSIQFARMDYTEAIRILEGAKQKFEFPFRGASTCSRTRRYHREARRRPVIVTNYPKAIKAFYMRVNEDDRTVAAMDVLAPGIGEIIGGSQREERLDAGCAAGRDRARPGALRLVSRPAALRHGAARGVRAGFEQFISYATGIANVRRDPIPADAGQRPLKAYAVRRPRSDTTRHLPSPSLSPGIARSTRSRPHASRLRLFQVNRDCHFGPIHEKAALPTDRNDTGARSCRSPAVAGW